MNFAGGAPESRAIPPVFPCRDDARLARRAEAPAVNAANTSELVLVSLAAMMSPTTLTFSVLALVLGDRPLRTGLWFFLGAFTATLAIGVIAAFVLGDAASPPAGTSTPTWVAILDVVLAVLLFVFAGRRITKPVDPEETQGMIEKMSGIASSPAIAAGSSTRLGRAQLGSGLLSTILGRRKTLPWLRHGLAGSKTRPHTVWGAFRLPSSPPGRC